MTVPVARVYYLRCLVLWRCTEMWHFVQHSPQHPRDAENEEIYLQKNQVKQKRNISLICICFVATLFD